MAATTLPFSNVAVVGFGTIGQRWAAAFAHAGLAVRCFDPDPSRWDQFAALQPGLDRDLAALRPRSGSWSQTSADGEAVSPLPWEKGQGVRVATASPTPPARSVPTLTPDPSPQGRGESPGILPRYVTTARSGRGTIDFWPDLAEAVSGVPFVQECGPELLPLKQDLLAAIEMHAGPETIIASSSSALRVSDMQARCTHPGRIVLGHPFNPAHLMPLVEIVGGRDTAPDTVTRTRSFYESIGKKPVVLNREVTGHLALRLMGAMWREAIALVRDGVASAEDIDRAFAYGPGPKWTLQGSFISNSLNAEGIASFLTRYGPTYQAIWDDLGTATLDPATIAAVASAVERQIGERTGEMLRSQRDRGLIAMLRAIAEDGAL